MLVIQILFFVEKNNYFSFNVFFMFFYAGNIEKCPFKKKIVVLAFVSVGGRSRATELPCFGKFPVARKLIING